MSSVIPLNKEARTALAYLEQHPDLQTAREKAAAERAWGAGYDQGYSTGYDHGHTIGLVSSAGA